MKRAIIVPAQPAPEALDELKQWLAITTSREDAALARLIAAGIELCEGFTGSVLLNCVCEEILAATGEWTLLSTRPVQGVLTVQALADDGARTPLAVGAYAVELETEGGARVRTPAAGATRLAAVQFVAGITPTWNELPISLRQGVIRYAAHLHRQRETETAVVSPPAAVAALWRPWRRVRLT